MDNTTEYDKIREISEYIRLDSKRYDLPPGGEKL